MINEKIPGLVLLMAAVIITSSCLLLSAAARNEGAGNGKSELEKEFVVVENPTKQPEVSRAAGAPEGGVAHFIIVAPTIKWSVLRTFVTTPSLAKSLGLSSDPSSPRITYILPNTPVKELLENINKGIAGQKVVIATGSSGPLIAAATQDIITRKLGHLHTVILFDPDTYVGTVSAAPITIHYSAIDNRVYNFYSEAASALHGFRKIQPGMVTTPPTPSVYFRRHNGNPPFLKGVNIKCYVAEGKATTAQILAQNFPFFSYAPLYLGFSETGMSDDFAGAGKSIAKAIATINENFLINTDLTCILSTKGQWPESCAPLEVPLVFVNRFAGISHEGKLTHVVATSAVPNKALVVSPDVVWESESIYQRHDDAIGMQLKAEARHNANALAACTYPHIASSIAQGFDITWPVKKPRLNVNLHGKGVAEVRLTPELTVEERTFAELRASHVAKAVFNKFPDLRDRTHRLPKIAVVTSGGGARAMLATFGFLKGLARSGLLDTVTYISALSGSTWALGASVFAHKDDQPFIDTLKAASSTIANNLSAMSQAGMAKLAPEFVKEAFGKHWSDTAPCEFQIKKFFGQHVSLTDFYAYILSGPLMNDDPKACESFPHYLSDQRPQFTKGAADIPFPIYTAITDDPVNYDRSGALPLEKYSHTEFTPFEVGGVRAGQPTFIPAWAFGRKFMYGISQDLRPEPAFATLMATFGSAEAFSARDLAATSTIKTYFGEFQVPSSILKARLTYPEFCNPAHALLEVQDRKENLPLVDAGLAFNLPYQPVSGLRPDRKADIVIFFDASQDFIGNPDLPLHDGVQTLASGGELEKVMKWAQSKGINFPEVSANISSITLSGKSSSVPLGSKLFNVFANKNDPKCPVVIYMPLAVDTTLLKNTTTLLKNTTILGDQLDWALEDNPISLQKNVEAQDLSKLNLGAYGTFKFDYTPEQANALMALAEFNLLANEKAIWDTIGNWCGKQTSVGELGAVGGQPSVGPTTETPTASVPPAGPTVLPAPVEQGEEETALVRRRNLPPSGDYVAVFVSNLTAMTPAEIVSNLTAMTPAERQKLLNALHDDSLDLITGKLRIAVAGPATGPSREAKINGILDYIETSGHKRK